MVPSSSKSSSLAICERPWTSDLINALSKAKSHILHVSIPLVNHLTTKSYPLRLDPTYTLLPPHCTESLDATMFSKVGAALATRFDVSVQTVLPRLQKAQISTWGKVRCIDGGDMMHAFMSVSRGVDHRDASFVRVSTCHICSLQF
jgi:hypothetical protein